MKLTNSSSNKTPGIVRRSLSGKKVPGAAVEADIKHFLVLSLGIQASLLLSASDPIATLGQ